LRLQWLVERTIPDPLYVAIRIQSRTGSIAALGGREIDFAQWPHRRLLTTYHALQLAPGLPPGVYDLQVGIGPDPFNVTWMPVTVAKIPFDDETFMGGVSGARADFGDIALLGYRLARTQNTLDIALMWQALADLAVDYRVLIQVRNEIGAVVAQLEAEPRDGNYPTSVWSAGEQVPDTYQLDITDLPSGNYQVFVSLIAPSGQRLLVLDGRDAVLVGFLAVLEENQSP
jgi:hypothetical protein